MKRNKIVGELYGTPGQREAWKKRLETESKKIRKAAEEYKRKEALRTQLVLPLNIPPTVLCNSCFGLGCKRCKNKGVLDGERTPEPEYRTSQCLRCWGVGQIASTEYLVRACPTCHGTGKVEALIE